MSRQVTLVADLLHSAAIHLLRRASEQDHTAPLSSSRLSALSVVVFRGPLALGELARAERVSSPSMSTLVTALEAAGLVRRLPHAVDGRLVMVEATADGRRVLDEARRRRIALIAELLDGLPQDDLDLLWRAGRMVEGRFGVRPWRTVGDPGQDTTND
jgi:DNA-binding MarR family transcriptional regulator